MRPWSGNTNSDSTSRTVKQGSAKVGDRLRVRPDCTKGRNPYYFNSSGQMDWTPGHVGTVERLSDTGCRLRFDDCPVGDDTQYWSYPWYDLEPDIPDAATLYKGRRRVRESRVMTPGEFLLEHHNYEMTRDEIAKSIRENSGFLNSNYRGGNRRSGPDRGLMHRWGGVPFHQGKFEETTDVALQVCLHPLQKNLLKYRIPAGRTHQSLLGKVIRILGGDHTGEMSFRTPDEIFFFLEECGIHVRKHIEFWAEAELHRDPRDFPKTPFYQRVLSPEFRGRFPELGSDFGFFD